MAPNNISDAIQLKEPSTKIGVSKFFSGQDVFITGGLGFMGKILIEKLLWSCEDINNIYLLVRSKKGLSVNERIEKLLELPVFDRIKESKPASFKKLIPIEGDVLEPNLGISESNRNILEKTVSTIFHVASSVRFDDPLKKSVLINIRGTKYVIDIAKRMKKLKVLLYVSTTFCNVQLEVIKEKMYFSKDNWRDMITLVETLDENTLNIFTTKLLDTHPNTYTYTKFLAENLIHEYSKELPCIIYRPSIVTCAISEPKSGWIDNLNGPVGLSLGVLTGVLHVLYIDPVSSFDYMPCDYAINGLLVAAWYKGISNSKECIIINGANGKKCPVGIKFVSEHTKNLVTTLPPHQLIWYPYFFITKNKFLYKILFLFTHIIPGILLDVILKYSKNNLRLIALYRKVYYMTDILEVFLCRKWEFDTKNFDSLRLFLSPEDEKTYFYDMTNVNNIDTLYIGLLGMKKYILKEKPTKEASVAADKHIKRMYWLHQITLGFLFIMFFAFVRFILKRYLQI